jgi:RecB family endonuclease NucS
VFTIQNPSIEECDQFIKKHHQKNPNKTFLQIIGKCQVDYHGRAKSFLDWGERIIMIKNDGNVLVHQPQMREPINWQPSGSLTDYRIINNKFIVSSRHNRPSEKMKIIFKSVNHILIARLRDNSTLNICGMETDVVKHIIEHPDFIEEGLRIQQSEKPVNSGMIDLFGYDKNHNPVVIEVKRSLATISAVHQLRMYVNDIKKGENDAIIRGILCAPRIPLMIQNLLKDYQLEWKEVNHEIVLADDFQKSLQDFE